MKTAISLPVPENRRVLFFHRQDWHQRVFPLGLFLALASTLALASLITLHAVSAQGATASPWQIPGWRQGFGLLPQPQRPEANLILANPPPDNDTLCTTTASLPENVLAIDLDIDSDNDGRINPDDEAEDQIEADDHPGKILTVNDADSDHNGFPDYADCSAGRPTGSAMSLVPIRVKMTLPPGKTWETCQLYIQYPALAENLRRVMPDGSVQELEPGTDTEPGATYLPPTTTWWGPWYDETSLRLRLWTKTGKFIAPGRYYSATIEDDPLRTFDYLGISGDTAIVEFWVEGGKGAANLQYLYFGLSEWESDSYVTDTINVTVNETSRNIDLDVDSDNSGTIDGNDGEDGIEDSAGTPGKIIPLANNGDVDHDGVPDFADGFDLEPETKKDTPAQKLDKAKDNRSTHAMIPIMLQLPDHVDLAIAKLRIEYDASAPADTKIVFKKDKKTYLLPPATTMVDPQDPAKTIILRKILRLWREKQDAQGQRLGLECRDKNSVRSSSEGSYVAPGIYGPAELARLGFNSKSPDGKTVTLWMEGVKPSLAPGDCRIAIYLDPDGDGPQTEQEFSDAVRTTVMTTAIVPDWNRDGIINEADQGKVTPDKPWRLWKNDDQDQTAEANGILVKDGVDLPGAGKNGDGMDLKVNGIRDLVDFFPFALNVERLRILYPPGNYQYRLRYPGRLHAFCGDAASGLSAANVGDLHKHIEIAETLKNRVLGEIDPAGLVLDTDFLSQPDPVVFIEGVNTGDGDLELAIQQGETTVFATRLPLQVCDVEQMFYRKDLGWVANNTFDGTGDSIPTRLPFFTSPNHYLVMVHGYDVNAEDARMCFAETYKRFFHSGCNVRYYGVNWDGRPASTSIGPRNYHQAVVNALATAPFFAEFINGLPGTRTVIAHSLGNMMVGEAICLPRKPAIITNYIALDAAVAKETWGDVVMPEDLAGRPLNEKGFFIDVRGWPYNVPLDNLSTWAEYVAAGHGQLLASEWYRLFDASDRRSQLTWRNRFKELPTRTHAYNFYSPTENVVGNLQDGNLMSDAGFLESLSCAWHKQEKLKGRRYAYNLIPGVNWENIGCSMSDFCGWSASPYYRQFKDEALNGLDWIFAIGHDIASISSFLSGTIEELTAAKQRFQQLGWIQTPVDIIMTTLGAINNVLSNTWSFLTGTLSHTAKKIDVLEIRFKDPQSQLKATLQPRASQAMARVQAMATLMSKKANKPITVNELLKVQPYFAVDSGFYLRYLTFLHKPRLQNLTQTINGRTPSDFLAKRASTIKEITEYYNKNLPALKRVIVKDWLLAEAFPATTNALGANAVNVDAVPQVSNTAMHPDCMTNLSRWPRTIKNNGQDILVWYHTDYKNVPFVHTYKLYEKITSISKPTGGNP